jgi:hypothetical protein
LIAVSLCAVAFALPVRAQPEPGAIDAASQKQVTPTASYSRVDVTLSSSWFPLTIKEGDYKGVTCNPPPNCSTIGGGHPEPSTPARQIGAGFYWTEHLKTEVAVAWTASSSGGARQDVYESEAIYTPSYTKYVYLLHTYDIGRSSLSQLYQFRSGKRWRPYLGVAVGVDRETDVDIRTEDVSAPLPDAERLRLIKLGVLLGGTVTTDTDILPTSLPPAVTATRVHVFGRAGFKAYVPKRVFLVVEIQGGPRVTPLSFGLGVDLF